MATPEQNRIRKIADEQMGKRNTLQFGETISDMPDIVCTEKDDENVPMIIAALSEMGVVLPQHWHPSKPGDIGVLLAAVNSRNKTMATVKQVLAEDAGSGSDQFSENDESLVSKRREIVSLLKETINAVLPEDFAWPKNSIDVMLAALQTRRAVQAKQLAARAKAAGNSSGNNVAVDRGEVQSQFSEGDEPNYKARADEQMKGYRRFRFGSRTAR